MSNTIRKAIITGASGGPGQALVRKLIAEGIEVLLLIRNSSGRSKYFPRSELIRYAHYELNQLKNFEPENSDYDVFFHLGWDYTDPVKRRDPFYQQKNIETTLDAVNLAYRAGCKRFIGCGSQAEYGIVNGKISPDTPCQPVIAYGMAKLCANSMAKLACENNGMMFNWLRVFSVYGPVDNPYNVFSTTILGILKGEKLEYTKGEQIWDLLYTEDLAEAFYLVAEKGVSGKIYTVGCGKEVTLRSEIETFAKLMDDKYPLLFGAIDYAKDQVMYLLSDNTKINHDTGWHPKTSLEEGARKTIQFWEYLYELYGDEIYTEYFKPGENIDWSNK